MTKRRAKIASALVGGDAKSLQAILTGYIASMPSHAATAAIEAEQVAWTELENAVSALTEWLNNEQLDNGRFSRDEVDIINMNLEWTANAFANWQRAAARAAR